MKTSEWTAALRSGKYPQGQFSLCDGTYYCCLGVLAEEAGLEKVIGEDDQIQYVFKLKNKKSVLEESVIPTDVRDDLLEDLHLSAFVMEETVDGVVYGVETLHSRLVGLNDNGASFEFIADYIDRVRANG